MALPPGFSRLIYGREPMLERMHMVPMVLPDGQIGYVLQQPGVQMLLSQPCKNDWSNSSSRTSGPMATVADGIDPTRGRWFFLGDLFIQIKRNMRTGLIENNVDERHFILF